MSPCFSLQGIKQFGLNPDHPIFQSQTARVKRVVDGDTLLLITGERVRLIGVDTPEMHESKKLYRDAERSGKDIKTLKALLEVKYG